MMRREMFSIVLGALLAALPASSNFQLHNYSVGAGGAATSSSTNFGVNGTAGEQSSVTVSSSNFADNGGNNGAQQANVPIVTITNPSNYYNKLKIVIDSQNNPTDATFAVAISTDNFTTTNYVKSDSTVGSTLVYPGDYRTLASWGGGGGALVIGLTAHTTYYVKAKAIQGKYSESAYGPVSNVATANPQLTFSLSTSSQPSPPFSIAVGILLAGTVVTAPDTANVAMTTNGEQGGSVYIADSNAALTSVAIPSATIPSSTADLTAASHGYGAQVASATQLTSTSPYNGASNNVGILSSTIRQILGAVAPVTAGSATISIMAKAASSDAAAPDYKDILTLIAAASF